MRIDPSIIINTLNKNEGKVRLTARKLGISPATVINWRNKAKPLRSCIRYTLKPILKRKSTQPKKKRITTLSQEQRHDILSLKNQYGYGASKIKCLAQITQSSRCIHRYLKSKALVVEGKNYRRPRYQQTTHMYLKNVHAPGKLQLDVKYVTPELSGLVHTTYLYATIDIYSRYKSGVILPSLDQALTIEALKYIIPQLPPVLFNNLDFIQTDNGLEYQHRFLTFLSQAKQEFSLPHHIKHHYIHKSSPNENAVIERSFRTDEEEFFWRLDNQPKDLIELNALYQQYLHCYNSYRPHLGLNMATPMQKLESFMSG